MPKPSRLRVWIPVATCALVALAYLIVLSAADDARAGEKARVAVAKSHIHFDDGDSIRIRWPGKDAEDIRILGIDTPEVLHLDHNLPYPQPFGEAAGGFLRGCIAASDKIELLRSGEKDKYGRTLGYLYVDGKNYSVLVIQARLAYGPNPRFGDNGLPEQNKACIEAAKTAGPPPFEQPWLYRKRMRAVSEHMKKAGTYPSCPAPEKPQAGK